MCWELKQVTLSVDITALGRVFCNKSNGMYLNVFQAVKKWHLGATLFFTLWDQLLLQTPLLRESPTASESHISRWNNSLSSTSYNVRSLKTTKKEARVKRLDNASRFQWFSTVIHVIIIQIKLIRLSFTDWMVWNCWMC